MALQETARTHVLMRYEYLLAEGARLVIDGDVHPTPFVHLPPEIAERVVRDPGYYHGRPLLSEALIATLDRARVDMAMCWQNPAVLTYADDPDTNMRLLLAANRAIAELACAHPRRVIPAGWTDPKALGTANAVALARLCVQEMGMPVVKMNPAQNAYPIDDPMVMEVVDAIVSLGAVPAFHFGSDTPYTPPEGLEAVARRHPNHPVIGIHMGGGGGHFVEAEPVYQASRALGIRRPNIFFILSAIRDPNIESAFLAYAAAGEPFCRNLAAGSDAPYGDMVWNYGGFRALLDAMRRGESYGDPRLTERPTLIDDATVSAYMGGNLAALIAAADARILGLDGQRSAL